MHVALGVGLVEIGDAKMSGARWTPEEDDVIRTLGGEILGPKGRGFLPGRSVSAIQNRARRIGIPLVRPDVRPGRRPIIHDEELKRRAASLRDEGHRFADIAQRMGISISTVYRLINGPSEPTEEQRARWERTRKEKMELLRSANGAGPSFWTRMDVLDVAKWGIQDMAEQVAERAGTSIDEVIEEYRRMDPDLSWIVYEGVDGHDVVLSLVITCPRCGSLYDTRMSHRTIPDMAVSTMTCHACKEEYYTMAMDGRWHSSVWREALVLLDDIEDWAWWIEEEEL